MRTFESRYEANVDDQEAWLDRQWYLALTDEERAANDAAVAEMLAAERAEREAEYAAQPEPPF